MGSIEVWKKAYRAVVQACLPHLNNIYLATQRLEQLLKRTQLMERWARWEITHLRCWTSMILPQTEIFLRINIRENLPMCLNEPKKIEDENRMIKEALLMINPNLQNMLFKAPSHATSSHNNKDIDGDESDDINSSSYNDDDNNYDDEDDTQETLD